MEITEALKSLENSWSREDILVKIKNGINSEKIINDFFYSKQKEIETLSNFINPENTILLGEIAELYNIESKLINKIKKRNLNNSHLSDFERKDNTTNLNTNKKTSFNLSIFMMKWSNKFVFISLLAISAIALTKQAWA